MELVHSYSSGSNNNVNDSEYLINNRANNIITKKIITILNSTVLNFIIYFGRYNNYIKYQLIIFFNYLIFNLIFFPNSYLQILIDIKDLFIYNTLIYYLANIEDKNFDTLLNIFITFITILIYYFIEDLKGFGSITFSNNNLEPETFNTMFIVIALFCIIVFYNIKIAKINNILIEYIGFIILIIIYILIFAYATLKNNRVLHLHHWFSGQILAILSRFNTKLSMLFHFFCLGIYLHGIIFYDAAFILD
jgi:hypothetical protein